MEPTLPLQCMKPYRICNHTAVATTGSTPPSQHKEQHRYRNAWNNSNNVIPVAVVVPPSAYLSVPEDGVVEQDAEKHQPQRQQLFPLRLGGN